MTGASPPLSFSRRLFDPGVTPWSKRTELIFEGVTLAVYTVVIITVTLHHEMWRDEVRALTMATTGESMVAMLRNLHEGHPAIWYLLLRAGHAVMGDAVLPVISATIAVAAVATMLRFSPFAPAQKVLLAFGTFFGYEYSVMSRNYGIGALLIFVIIALYRWRVERPLLWGLLLALLANTSVYAAITALALTAGWCWDLWRERDRVRPPDLATHGGLLIAIAGAALCAWVSRPPTGTVAVTTAINPESIAAALLGTLLEPGMSFGSLVPLPMRSLYWGPASTVGPFLATAVFIAAIVALRHRTSLLITFTAALIGFGMFSRLGYRGYIRHAGLLYCLLIGIYWLALIERRTATPRRQRDILVALTIPLTVLMAAQAWHGVALSLNDIRYPRSSSAALGALLHRSEYANAILIGEPDHRIEAVPYYAPNRMYLPRLAAFSRYSLFTTAERASLSLGELLQSADSVRTATGSPVLIAISHDLAPEAGDVAFGFGSRFRWTPEEHRTFTARVREVARFGGALTDENYVVFELLPERARTEFVNALVHARFFFGRP